MNQVVALTLCLMNPPHAAIAGFQPTACYELATYGTRAECDINARSLRVEVKARLLCQPREITPDERQALHVLQWKGR